MKDSVSVEADATNGGIAGFARGTLDATDIVARVNFATQDLLLADLEDHLRARRGFAVATLNLDHLVKLRQSALFRAAYASHSHVVADGNPIVWVSRLTDRPVGLVPGSELITPLMAMAARLGVPVALLGSTPATLDVAAARLAAMHPGLQIVARIAPPFGFDPQGEAADACLAAITQSGARLCLLALGAPKQEIFAARATARLADCGFVSIGAGLDFIAGTQRRAPRWVRRIAMEWFWRMASDPKRLVLRYWRCIVILPGLMLSALRDSGLAHHDTRKRRG